MQLASSHSGWQRWVLPVLLSVIVPLLFAALPGEALHVLARHASLVKQAGIEIATLHAVRTGFQQLRATEGGILSGRSAEAQKLAVPDIRRALNRIAGNSGPAAQNVAALQDAVEGYARDLRDRTATRRYDDPPAQALSVSTASHAIESVLGQLQTRDEARLREPLLAMRQAEASLRSEREPRSAEQVSRSAEIFAARLDGMAIPPGTRTALLARLAAYQHAVLSPADAFLVRQADWDRLQAAARAVETALANAEQALTAEQQRVNETFQVAGKRFVWSFVAVLAASLLIVGGVSIGRMALDHGVTRTRHAR